MDLIGSMRSVNSGSRHESGDGGMLAGRGPRAVVIAAPLLLGSLGTGALELGAFESLDQDGVFVARTGCTGEDGWDILRDSDAAGPGGWPGRWREGGILPLGS